MIAPWNRDYASLQREVCRPVYAPLLADLHGDAPETADLTSWPAVAEFVRRLGIRTARADLVLRPLVGGFRASGDPLASTILLLLFTPAIITIQRRQRGWLRDNDERWALICRCFLRSLRRLDPARRTERLGQKLLNDTGRRLYDECAREWKIQRRVDVVDPDELDLLIGGVEDPRLEAIELRQIQDAAIRRVRSAAAAGVVSINDAYLILGTRIYGAELHDAAQQLDIPYERAKKRRQRAEASLGRKNLRVDPENLVPE